MKTGHILKAQAIMDERTFSLVLLLVLNVLKLHSSQKKLFWKWLGRISVVIILYGLNLILSVYYLDFGLVRIWLDQILMNP